MPSSPDMVYRVDSEDRLEYVNDVWETFAHDSNTDSLSSASVLKHSLWDYISDRTTRGIYKAMLTHGMCEPCLAKFTAELRK
jgi:hypothetical protein